MAGKSSPKDARLLEVTSQCFLDYCIYQLWKEFKEKRSFSDCWRDEIQDFLASRRFDIGEELSNKLNCIRFIVGLLEHQEDEPCASQESSDEEDQEKGLRPECLKFFDKISGIYPFSDVEKSHMRNTLKLQIILSYYRCGDSKGAEKLYSELYTENGHDEEYQDDLRELFQSENDSFKEKFLRKHTYDKLLNQVQKFFTPAWKKFEIPIFAEAPFLEESNKERPRIDAKTLKALYFAWDKSDEAEQNWTSVVERTHPDITALKRKITKRNNKDPTSSTAEGSPSTRLRQQVTKSRAEASSTAATSTSVSENIQRCQDVMKNLKTSSSQLFSGLKDPYSNMVTGRAGPSGVNGNVDDNDDQDFTVTKRCKTVVAIPDSPSGKKVDNKGKKPLESRSTKRRYNEEHSDAEEIDWESDDDETETTHKAIKLPSPAKHRCLNIKLPINQSRKFWTTEETNWLEEGVKLYGEGSWAKILSKYNFVGRTSVNLKDRWRNLQKNNL
ncbi:Telomeric repeat-binding factor [Desmophyllum pertusum]|uniref:Telomeric repeat-binding factor n=1 Tax=Desmophyllum pertusum TaxID=174260 RepID=A0A9X0A2Q4_9CNID|nr:Telomeric repeat-binding factor [Desmophyllum pertusum]